MGELRISGVNILNYTTPVSKSEAGEQCSAFPTKIKGISSEVDNGTKKIVTGWSLPNTLGYSTDSNYDATRGRLKVNGTSVSVMYDGTRPRNIVKKALKAEVGMNYYLNNVNGKLYLSTSEGSATGTFIIESKAPNKDCVVSIALWGAGGRGGSGAFWLFAGNWGGVGGAGGGKGIFVLSIKNNSWVRFWTSPETGDYVQGRILNSNDTTYYASGLYVYIKECVNNTSAALAATGGYSGISNHPRWASDNFTTDRGSGSVVYYTESLNINGSNKTIDKSSLPFILASQNSKTTKRTNGLSGNSMSLSNTGLAFNMWGNPEGNQGVMSSVGSGGRGPDSSYNQSHGSGGGGSWGAGGNAGDTGSGSNGSNGVNGGGGGGSGSPSGGANGGYGGYAGFLIAY